MASSDAVRKEVWKAIEEANQKFAQIEQIKRFGVLERDLSQEEGELTPTMKVKRRGPAPSRRLAAANRRDRRDRAGAPRLQPRRREPLEVRGELRHRCRAVTSCTVRYPPRADTSVSERRRPNRGNCPRTCISPVTSRSDGRGRDYACPRCIRPVTSFSNRRDRGYARARVPRAAADSPPIAPRARGSPERRGSPGSPWLARTPSPPTSGRCGRVRHANAEPRAGRPALGLPRRSGQSRGAALRPRMRRTTRSPRRGEIPCVIRSPRMTFG